MEFVFDKAPGCVLLLNLAAPGRHGIDKLLRQLDRFLSADMALGDIRLNHPFTEVFVRAH